MLRTKIVTYKKLGLPRFKNKNDNIHKNEVQNIGFGIPIEFLSQRKKNYLNRGVVRTVILRSTISNIESQSKFQVKEKKILKSV